MIDSAALPTLRVLRDVAAERERQEEIGREKRAAGVEWRSCADPLMEGGDDKRLVVLGEEYGEACRAVLERGYVPAPRHPLTDGLRAAFERDLRTELVQVAAVAVAFVEAIDARAAAEIAP